MATVESLSLVVESLTQSIADLKNTLLEKLEVNNKEVTSKVNTLEGTLSNTSKELTDAILFIRNHVLNLLRDENVCLRDRVHTLEDRLIRVERQVNRVEQNNRKNNVEFDGIPDNVTQEELAPTVVNIVNAVGDVKIGVNDVEAVHRLHSKRSPKPVIVKLKRNVIDSVRENRKKLKDVARNLNLRGGGIFLNHNLSPNMKTIEFNARKLLKDGLVGGVWFSNASVRIKCLNGKTLSLDHEIDLFEAFPCYEGFSFDTNFYDKILNDDLMDQYNGYYGFGEANVDIPSVPSI
jgi:polyhydroxyalkanoate synthesis regulator phasin